MDPAPKADTLEERFNYHTPPNEAVIETHWLIRKQMLGAAQMVCDNCPPCRELSLAVTKLEEAMFWANAAVARNHDHYREDSG
jgi:hypothetical protein